MYTESVRIETEYEYKSEGRAWGCQIYRETEMEGGNNKICIWKETSKLFDANTRAQVSEVREWGCRFDCDKGKGRKIKNKKRARNEEKKEKKNKRTKERKKIKRKKEKKKKTVTCMLGHAGYVQFRCH